jgi:hypothetical protein
VGPPPAAEVEASPELDDEPQAVRARADRAAAAVRATRRREAKDTELLLWVMSGGATVAPHQSEGNHIAEHPTPVCPNRDQAVTAASQDRAWCAAMRRAYSSPESLTVRSWVS